MLRVAKKYLLAGSVTATVVSILVTAAAADLKNPNEIIRSLAPIDYLPEHGGGAPGPSIDLTIPFELDSAKLKLEAQVQLRALGAALGSKELKDKAIEIAGHTDATGEAGYNRKLSERRAQAVIDFLVKTFGFQVSRFRSVGYGEDELKDPLAPEAAVNRRVEISVLSGTIPIKKAPPKPKLHKVEGTRILDNEKAVSEDGKIKW